MILHKPETTSTNADMLALAREGAAEGAWLYADAQTRGRGRRGRVWVSPPGNLYASGLVRLRNDDPPAATLALVAGVVVWEVVDSIARTAADGRHPRKGADDDIGERLHLKWPNDLLADGAKLGGILLEREGDAVVIGVGLNLAHHPDLADRPATSFAALGISTPSPAEAVEALAAAIAHWLSIWRGAGMSAISPAWMARAHPIGTTLRIDTGRGARCAGAFAGLDSGGALILRLADGTQSVIHTGDVFLV